MAKPESNIVLNAKVAAVDDVVRPDWQVVESCDVLGWTIQNDAGISKQWNSLVPRLWAAFYANLRQAGSHRLVITRQFALLTRSVETIALLALSAWGPTLTSTH